MRPKRVSSQIELPATVEVSTDALLDAIGALEAVGLLHTNLTAMLVGEPTETDSEVGAWCAGHVTALIRAAFGDPPEPEPGEDDDDVYNRWTVEVERAARGSAMAATLLELQVQDEAADERGLDLRERARVKARYSTLVRERGTMMVMYDEAAAE